MENNSDIEGEGFEQESSDFSWESNKIKFTAPTGEWKNTPERQWAFLERAMSDFFGVKPYTGYFLPKLVNGRLEIHEIYGSFPTDNGGVVDIPLGRRRSKCVYYNRHYYLEIEDPSRLQYSGDPKRLYLTFESEIYINTKFQKITPPRIKWVDNPVDPRHKSPVYMKIPEYIEGLESEWKDQGYTLLPIEDNNQDTCRYCGKHLTTNKRVGRYPEFCDDKCHQDYIRFYNRIKLYAEKEYPNVEERNIFLESLNKLYKMGYTPKEIESRYLSSRCWCCGKIISSEKRKESKFCERLCRIEFNNRLKKEKKTNPDLTPEDLVEILRNERKTEIKKQLEEKKRESVIEVLKDYLRRDLPLPEVGGEYYDKLFDGRFYETLSEIKVEVEEEKRLNPVLPKDLVKKREKDLKDLDDYVHWGGYDEKWEGHFKKVFGDEFEDLVKMFSKRVEIEYLNYLEVYISKGISTDDRSPGSETNFIREYFGDKKFERYVTKIKDKLKEGKSFVFEEYGQNPEG